MKNKVAKQAANGGGKASMQNTSTGSGSRPSGSRFMTSSSNPQHAQKIRPTNKIGS